MTWVCSLPARAMTRAMTARDVEAALLRRCAAAAREAAPTAADQREAHVFRLAASAVRSRFPHEAANLLRASERYFALHPDERLPSAEVLRQGWIAGLPRLRDRLSRQLCKP